MPSGAAGAGIGAPAGELHGELEITLSFATTMRNRRDEPDHSWVRESIRTDAIRRAITDAFSMDSDHTNMSVNDIGFDVTALDLHN